MSSISDKHPEMSSSSTSKNQTPSANNAGTHASFFASHTASVALGAVIAGVAAVGVIIAVQNGVFSTDVEAAKTRQLAQNLEQEITTPTEFKEKTTKYADDTTTDVLLDAPDVDASDIVKIIKHGDHWHVFTKDGREIITYKDPTRAHTASDLQDVHSVVSNSELSDMGVQVVKILQHGNHWHVYTSDGREFITYSDPSSYYPNITIGTYTGSHNHESYTHPAFDGGSGQDYSVTPSYGSSSDSSSSSFVPNIPGLVEVHRGVDEVKNKRIVKILKHEDHWHVYDSDGHEYVTHTDPSPYFPGITVGTYTGCHDGNCDHSHEHEHVDHNNYNEHAEHTHHADDTSNSQQPPVVPSHTPSDTGEPLPQIPDLVEVHSGLDEIRNKNIVKILKHEDHWHVYDSDGQEYIVRSDPRQEFPYAVVGEYDKNVDHVVIEDGDLFDYNKVPSANKVSLADLDKVFRDLKYMKAYDAKTNRFYAWHMEPGKEHIHSHALEEVIKSVKADAAYFASKQITARDVVATLKWIIGHPESQPQDETNKYFQKEYEGHSAEDWLVDNNVKKPSRSVKDKEYGSVFYWVFYADGTAAQWKSDVSAYEKFHLKVDDYTKTGNLNATLESVEAELCQKFGVSTDEFENAWLHLPVNSSIHAAVFNDDGTVTIYGTTYSFLKDKIKSGKSEAAPAQRSTESSTASPAQAQSTVKSSTASPVQKTPSQQTPADLDKVSDSSLSASAPVSSDKAAPADDHDVSASANTNAAAPVSQ